MKTLSPLVLVMLAGSALAAPFAYVPNEKSATISVIDTATEPGQPQIAEKRGLLGGLDSLGDHLEI